MTFATRTIPTNGRQETAVRYDAPLNGQPENSVLFEDFIACCQVKKYSIRTREVYWGWIKRFMLYHRNCDSSLLRVAELEQFMASLDVQGRVTTSTRNQALSALLFLYREMLHRDAGRLKNAPWVKSPKPMSAALSAAEVKRVLARLHGDHWLAASLLFGTGMHVLECLRLRTRDIFLAKNEILVRGVRDEVVKRIGIPPHLLQALKLRLRKALDDHAEDMKSDWQGVYMPESLLMEYPNVGKLLAWQYVFAAKRLPHDPCDGKIRRYHLDVREFQRALARAASEAGIDKPIGTYESGTVIAGRSPRNQK